MSQDYSQYFSFQFGKVYQSDKVFKIGTDAVLLAAWIKGLEGENLLEIGSGTGVVSCILHHRFPNIKITAIDSSAEAVRLTQANFKENAISNYKVELIEIQQYASVSNLNYSTIVSNPPFFINSLPAEKANKLAGKHTQTLSPNVLFAAIQKLLKPNGVCYLVYPYSLLPDIELALKKNELFLHQICHVSPFENSPPNRILLKIGNKNIQATQDKLYLYQQPCEPSRDYLSLVGDLLEKYRRR